MGFGKIGKSVAGFVKDPVGTTSKELGRAEKNTRAERDRALKNLRNERDRAIEQCKEIGGEVSKRFKQATTDLGHPPPEITRQGLPAIRAYPLEKRARDASPPSRSLIPSGRNTTTTPTTASFSSYANGHPLALTDSRNRVYRVDKLTRSGQVSGKVVLKVIANPDEYKHELNVLLSLREVDIAARFLGEGEYEGKPALELESGVCSLADWLHHVESEGVASRHQLQAHMLAAFNLIQQLHRYGWVHNDIKLSNFVLFGTSHRMKLIDFGSARRIGEPVGNAWTAYTVPPELVKFVLRGTLDAPRAAPAAAPATDLWQLGLVFCELMCGALPFVKGANEREAQMELERWPNDSQSLLHNRFPTGFGVFESTCKAAQLVAGFLTADPDLRLEQVQGLVTHLYLGGRGAGRTTMDLMMGTRNSQQYSHAAALIVGVSRFSSTTKPHLAMFSDLPGVRNSVVELEALWKGRGFSVQSVTDKTPSDQVTKEEITKAAQRLVRDVGDKAGRDSLLIVHLLGHGVGDRDGGLVLSDAYRAEFASGQFGRHSRFDADSLKGLLRGDAGWLGCNILVVCDFCNSGALLKDDADISMCNPVARLGYSRQMILSSLPATPSYMSLDGKRTRLTELLVSALGPSLEAFRVGEEHISAVGLRQRLCSLDKKNTFQAMLVGRIWDEWSGTRNDGDIFLFKTGSGVA